MRNQKRLLSAVHGSGRCLAASVLFQWLGLCANLVTIFAVTALLEKIFEQTAQQGDFLRCAGIVAAAVAVRFVCTAAAGRMNFLASSRAKSTLRKLIFQKLLRLGPSYSAHISTAEVVQAGVEGTEQLDAYFGAFLPQLFYSLLAPLTLFCVLGFVNFPAAVVLLACVPLIPIAIILVQKRAKKLMGRYWGRYASLGDTFLENLQGMTTLKIYRADGRMHKKMDTEAESFRAATMRVLVMQLQSIAVMDLVAYGGAAVGILTALWQFYAGKLGLGGCAALVLLSAEFFLPLRQLGSYFHAAMTGMAASGRIFRLVDLPEESWGGTVLSHTDGGIIVKDLSFCYGQDRAVLQNIHAEFPQGSFTAIVGESGCGKSTLAGILTGKNRGYSGSVTIGGVGLSEISAESLAKQVTYLGHSSLIFSGTVRENLLLGNSGAKDAELWAALEQVRLADFLRAEQGLDTRLSEQGQNFSGGQRQRLALARALLHDSAVYVFDEATSNIDAESEAAILEFILRLRGKKTVIFITHRIANARAADRIYGMAQGEIVGEGDFSEMEKNNAVFRKLWETQSRLEEFGVTDTREEADVQ